MPRRNAICCYRLFSRLCLLLFQNLHYIQVTSVEKTHILSLENMYKLIVRKYFYHNLDRIKNLKSHTTNDAKKYIFIVLKILMNLLCMRKRIQNNIWPILCICFHSSVHVRKEHNFLPLCCLQTYDVDCRDKANFRNYSVTWCNMK